MSDPFEQVDSVRIFFKDGSCAFLKNHKRDVNEIITQLTDERAALQAENERLRQTLDYVFEDWVAFKAHQSGGAGIEMSYRQWQRDKGVQS
jgi:regulator of replication initiation timing